MMEPVDCQAELIEESAFRRVWYLTGFIDEAEVEWALDRTPLGQVFGSERVLVNGIVVWKDLALTNGLVVWIDFTVPSPAGSIPVRLERYLRKGTVEALCLSVDGSPVHVENEPFFHVTRRPSLPVAAGPPHTDAFQLPRPSAPSSNSLRNGPRFPPGRGIRSQVKEWLALAAVLLPLAMVIAPIGYMWHRFQQEYGDPELVRAAARGEHVKVLRLLEHGSPANSYHLEGSSALWWAISTGSLETVEVLLAHGADPNSRGQWDSCIEQAIQHLDDHDGKPRLAIAKALLYRAALIKNPQQVRLLRDAIEPKGRSGVPDDGQMLP